MKKLLIIGAGEYGRLVKDLALESGYDDADFLDDNSQLAIGKIADYKKFVGEYDEFIVAMGNPQVRKKCVEMLSADFKLATIIHPRAYVSGDAAIGAGSIVEPGCVVYRACTIGQACLINAGAVLNHDSTVGDFCQIGCNAVVTARAVVAAGTKVEHGNVVHSAI